MNDEEREFRVMRTQLNTEIYSVRARSADDARRRLADRPDARRDVHLIADDREVDVKVVDS